MTLIVLIGVPGTGKTTYAEKSGLPYVSRDRFKRSSIQRIVWLEELGKYLARGEDVIADSTAVRRGTRDRLRALASVHKAPCVAVVFNNTAEGVARNALRAEPVPDSGMIGLIRDFHETTQTLESEGFSRILYLVNDHPLPRPTIYRSSHNLIPTPDGGTGFGPGQTPPPLTKQGLRGANLANSGTT